MSTETIIAIIAILLVLTGYFAAAWLMAPFIVALVMTGIMVGFLVILGGFILTTLAN